MDFIAKFTLESKAPIGICQVMTKMWRVYVDGALNIRGSRIGIVMVSFEGVRLEWSLRLSFHAFNNEVEYEALISDL